jgi:hypothetical protein
VIMAGSAEEGVAEEGGQLSEGLGDDGGLSEDGHEIGVAGPAWDDVDMEVIGDSGASDAAEVDADVEAVGFHDLGEGILTPAGKDHEVGEFGFGEVVEVRGLTVRDDEEMAAVVGIGIEKCEAGSIAGDDMVGDIVIGLGDAREEGGVARRGFGGEDVLDSPGSVEDFHGGGVG